MRYADDFVIVHRDKEILRKYIISLQNFLHEALRISLHPDKIYIRKIHQGVDFLGYILLPHYKRIRNKTKRRMMKRLRQKRSAFEKGNITLGQYSQSVESYKGMLKHANSFKLLEEIQELRKIQKNGIIHHIKHITKNTMNTASGNPEVPEESEVELNPESVTQVAEYIAGVKNSDGIKKIQSWFDGLEEETKRKLLRAEDISAIGKLLEKMPTPPGITDIMKSLIIVAARYGVLNVREDILAESRGVSGDILYHLPESVVTVGLRALGAGNLVPLYKIGKKIHSGDEMYAPRVRQEVAKKMAELRRSAAMQEAA